MTRYYVDDNCGWGPTTVRRVEAEETEEEYDGRFAQAEIQAERYNEGIVASSGDRDYACWWRDLPKGEPDAQ